MTAPTSMEAQFERIHGELALVNTKLDHEAEWRSNELTGLKQLVEDLKSTILSVKDHADKVGSNVRVDLERQVHDAKVDLAEHEADAHPHALQEEWIKSACHELTIRMDHIDRADPDHPGRLTRIEQRTNKQDGMLTVLKWAGAGLTTVSTGITVYVIAQAVNHGVWG